MSGNDQNITGLPEIDEATIDRMETAVFDQLEERPPGSSPRRSRARRRWLTAGGIAAAFVVGVLVTPAVSSVMNRTSMSAVDEAAPSAPIGVPIDGLQMESLPGLSGEGANGAVPDTAVPDADAAGRDVITAARVTLRVDDIDAAVKSVTGIAEARGGYVEGSDIAADTTSDAVEAGSAEGSWLSVRVPADELTSVVSDLGQTGEIMRSSLSRQDVTSTTRDLQARVDASRASVERLTELMSKSGSLSDLIAAESALAERQAQLESYQQELKGLNDQVAMSTVQVQLTERAAATAEPAGFADGLLTGWNGLIASLNAVVVAVGFLLPWVAVAGVAVLIVWLVRRFVVRRRSRAPADVEA